MVTKHALFTHMFYLDGILCVHCSEHVAGSLAESCGMQNGYNLLYGCLKYSWDADCELFLKILRGEVKEEVYVEQIQLQVLSRHSTHSSAAKLCENCENKQLLIH